jgi:hypothetical protein
MLGVEGGRDQEFPPAGEEEFWVGTTRSGVLDLAAADLTLAVAFFFGFPTAALGYAVDLG